MKKVVIILSVALIVFLLLPFALKDRSRTWLEGPGLSDLKYTEVSFRNGRLTLAGMLFLPETEGPCPAVVVIHGSGASHRDSPWYLTVVGYLQEHGAAVLLPDKRGSEKSQGDWVTATFEDLAGDTDAAVDFLKHQTTFECSGIGVIGLSQGGWIAPVVADRNDAVAFVVTMSGPGVTTDEQLLHEVANGIADFGTYRFVARLIAPLAAETVKRKAYWRVIGGFDPVPYWRRVTVPSFMAFGEGDKNVPVEESVARMRALRMHNIAVKVYPKGGHGIVDPATHRVQESYLRDLAAFVTAVTAKR